MSVTAAHQGLNHRAMATGCLVATVGGRPGAPLSVSLTIVQTRSPSLNGWRRVVGNLGPLLVAAAKG